MFACTPTELDEVFPRYAGVNLSVRTSADIQNGISPLRGGEPDLWGECGQAGAYFPATRG